MPKRKPTRLQKYDYSQNGYYFITICTKNKEKLLCHIVGEGLCALPSVKLTVIGEIVKQAIEYINRAYPGILIDKYVIMPNHIHLIIKIQTDGCELFPGRTPDTHPQIYTIIGSFKSFTTHKYGRALWQRSFHDHIIRDEADYRKIWNYIETNPARWKEDCFFVKE